MRIVVDRNRCEGHGMCAGTAPSLMHLDDEGALVIDAERVDDQLELARAAVRICPVAALQLED